MRIAHCVAALAVLTAAVGCDGDTPKRVTQERPKTPALDRVKYILTEYATGTPVGSEMIEFDNLVQELKASSPEKAILVNEAFDKFRKRSGEKVAAEAKDLLGKL